MPLRRQLEGKRRDVEAALDEEELDFVRVLPCLPSPKILGYRNRAKMAVEVAGPGRLELGYYREGTRHLVDAPECRVLEPDLLATLGSVREALARMGPAASGLRHVDLRCGSDTQRQHLVAIVDARSRAEPRWDALRRAASFVTGISINRHPGSGPLVVKGPIEHAWGEREVWVELPTVKLRVSPGAFFQVNLSILEAIHERMRDFLGTGRSLVDLYAGVGTHGLALHDAFDRVTCIEGVRRSALDAKASIETSGIRSATVIASPVERALRGFTEARPDAVILNPSRQGAELRVMQAIVRSRAGRVAYLSCDPKTMARDLVPLIEGGFEAEAVLPLDMMPQTRHVEALALLERRR